MVERVGPNMFEQLHNTRMIAGSSILPSCFA